MKQTLKDTAQLARADMSKISDPKAQALFETSADVLLGLANAFEDLSKSAKKHGKLPARANSRIMDIKQPDTA